MARLDGRMGVAAGGPASWRDTAGTSRVDSVHLTPAAMKPVLCAAALVLLAGCGDREPSPSLADRAAAISAGMNVDTLDVGGRPEQVGFREAAGSTFPVPFAVRVPDPMAVTTTRTPAGETVVLTAARQGRWSLTLLADGTAEAAARAAADSTARTLGTPTADSSAAGAMSAFTTGLGRVWLGQHAGRFYVVQSASDTEATREAFEARVAYVEQGWTWTDDGTTLGG